MSRVALFGLGLAGCNAVTGAILSSAEGKPSAPGHVVGADGDRGFVRVDDRVYVRRSEGLYVVSTLHGTQARTEEDALPAAPVNDCAERLSLRYTGGCGGFDLRGRALVRIAGCRDDSRFQGPRPSRPIFTADCATMFFDYDGQVFIVDVARAHAADLAVGTLVGVEPRP